MIVRVCRACAGGNPDPRTDDFFFGRCAKCGANDVSLYRLTVQQAARATRADIQRAANAVERALGLPSVPVAVEQAADFEKVRKATDEAFTRAYYAEPSPDHVPYSGLGAWVPQTGATVEPLIDKADAVKLLNADLRDSGIGPDALRIPPERFFKTSPMHVVAAIARDIAAMGEAVADPFFGTDRSASDRALGRRIIPDDEPEAPEDRANRLADECQRITDENRELLVENARLRRDLERKGRKP